MLATSRPHVHQRTIVLRGVAGQRREAAPSRVLDGGRRAHLRKPKQRQEAKKSTVPRYAATVGAILAPLCEWAPSGKVKARQDTIAARALVEVAGACFPDQLTAAHVTQIVGDWQHRNWSQWTYYTTWPSLRRVLDRLALVGAPPNLQKFVPRINLPAYRATHFPPEHLALLLAARCPVWLRCLVLLCHDCGLRARTALQCGPENYNTSAQTITTITKRGLSVTVPVSARLARVLVLATTGGSFVAALAGVTAVSYSAARAAYVRLCQDAGLPPGYQLHDLRRTVARELYAATGSIQQVQALLGHDSPKTTLSYICDAVVAVKPGALAKINGGNDAD